MSQTTAATAMQRADELLRQMTTEEKAMQLSSVFPLALFDINGTNRSQLDALLKSWAVPLPVCRLAVLVAA